MCANHHLLGLPTEDQRLVLLNCTMVGINNRRFDNQNTFPSLEPAGKEKRSIFKIFTFWKFLGYNMHLKCYI